MGLVLTWHNDASKEWRALSSQATNPSAISYKPKINSRTVQGESNGVRARGETGDQDGEEQDDEEVEIGQATVYDESRANISVHGFWRWGNTNLYDMIIFNLDAGSYLLKTSPKSLATAEKYKKEKYFQHCLEGQRYFNPMVYLADGITGMEAVAAQRRLTSLLSNKLERECLEMCGFVRDQM